MIPALRIAGAVLSLSLAFAVAGLAAAAEPVEGQRMPAFAVKDTAGKQHTMSRYKGDVLILHFWATWCPYCRGEIPELTQLSQAAAGQGAKVLAVSVDRDSKALQQFLDQHKLPYPVVADAGASLANEYGVEGLPTSFIVAPDGRLSEILPGAGDLHGAVARARKAR